MSNVSRIPAGQLSESRSTKASAAQMLTEAFESLSSRAVRAVGPTGQPMNIPVAWPHGRSPSNEERTALLRIVTAIHQAMQVPATDDEMSEQWDLLFNSRSLYGADAVGKSRVYSLVMADVPKAILVAAISQIIRGKADGIGKDLPSTDVLLDFCERLQRDVMAKALMVERMLALPEQPAPHEPSPEEVARNRERLAALGKPRQMSEGRA